MMTVRHTVENWPEIQTDFRPAMRDVARIIKRSVTLTFQVGGRPVPFVPLKSGGETPLVGSGKLMRSLREYYGIEWAEVVAGEQLPYAAIHQHGGIIHQDVTEKQRKFFWARWYDTGDEMWKRMALSNELNIIIPRRPYMVLQEQDIEEILELIGNFVLTYPELDRRRQRFEGKTRYFKQ